MLLPLKSLVTDIKVTSLAFLFAFVQFLCEPFNCEPICITSFLKLCFLPMLPSSVLLCDIVWNFFFNKEMEQISSYSYHDDYSYFDGDLYFFCCYSFERSLTVWFVTFVKVFFSRIWKIWILIQWKSFYNHNFMYLSSSIYLSNVY